MTTHTCATCATYNPSPVDDEPLCWNLIAIDRTDVTAGGVCDQHITPAEDAMEIDMVGAYRRIGCEWAVDGYLQACALARNVIKKAAGK